MSVAFTSRLAYKAVQDDLAGLQREVWEAICHWSDLRGPSIQELAVNLGRKEASICGRIDELRKAGAIHDGPLKPGKCRVQVKTYTAVVWRPCIIQKPRRARHVNAAFTTAFTTAKSLP